ncbi:MAG TPA: DUF4388 domain-containing protein [Nitrolancea sp.]|jgi:hypothetical protein|nr:DUF4388 domain-containing protein [Nitrolancea sp.]
MGFSGDLDDLPLQDVLYLLSTRHRSGRLTLRTSMNEFVLLFDHGRVASVVTDDDSLRIGRLLVEQGYVTEAQLEQALALQDVTDRTTRIGDVLVALGFVTRQQIGQAVAGQFEASLFRVLLYPNGTLEFEPEESIKVDPFVQDTSVELMILNAVRMADEWLASNTPNEAIELEDVPFNPAMFDRMGEIEKSVLLAILNGVSTSHELAKSTGIPAPDLRAALMSLTSASLISRHEIDDDDPTNDMPVPSGSPAMAR